MNVKVFAIISLFSSILNSVTINFKNEIENSQIEISACYLKGKKENLYISHKKTEIYTYDHTEDKNGLLFMEITVYRKNKATVIGQIRFNSINKEFSYIPLLRSFNKDIPEGNLDGKTVIFKLDDSGKIAVTAL